MAGNTGKLTAEALQARGPRMRLLQARRGTENLGLLVAREGREPFREGIQYSEVPSRFGRATYVSYASSYTLGYLLWIGKML